MVLISNFFNMHLTNYILLPFVSQMYPTPSVKHCCARSPFLVRYKQFPSPIMSLECLLIPTKYSKDNNNDFIQYNI